MWAYIIRRLLLMIPTVLGILVITFVLFTYVSADPARAFVGKIYTQEQLQAVRHKLGLDIPRWLNFNGLSAEERQAAEARGSGALAWAKFAKVFDSQFGRLMLFRFPNSWHYQEPIWTLIAHKAPVSLAIQAPVFFITLGIQLVLALYIASHRGQISDIAATIGAVLGMSIPTLSVYYMFQWFFGAYLKWFPPAGWDTWKYAIHFMALPILVSVVVGVGGGVRFYRTIALEEIGNDYVRTARAKGVRPRDILLTHVLRNLMIPVVTNTVVALPFLFMGALLLEHLFQIPGFGNLLVEAIGNQDQPVVMDVMYVTSIVYCLALVATDICYTLVDPRVVLK